MARNGRSRAANMAGGPSSTARRRTGADPHRRPPEGGSGKGGGRARQPPYRQKDAGAAADPAAPRRFCPQVCRTATNPISAPRCRGSAAMTRSVSRRVGRLPENLVRGRPSGEGGLDSNSQSPLKDSTGFPLTRSPPNGAGTGAIDPDSGVPSAARFVADSPPGGRRIRTLGPPAIASSTGTGLTRHRQTPRIIITCLSAARRRPNPSGGSCRAGA